jgi:hypothetical protein
MHKLPNVAFAIGLSVAGYNVAKADQPGPQVGLYPGYQG